jgi:hypothetical protein
MFKLFYENAFYNMRKCMPLDFNDIACKIFD